jgi:hypothetical protein
MNPFRLMSLSLAATTVLLAVPATTGAKPTNDGRDDAQLIEKLPKSISGTTDGASLEAGELGSSCSGDSNSVWFRYDARHDVRVVGRLQAGVDLDATFTVYLRLRSNQRELACDITDTHGRGAIAFTARKGESYLIRVAQRPDSTSGPFQLNLSPAPKQRIPGPALPRGGVAGSLDRASLPAQPWAVGMSAGVHYRIALEQRGSACLTASLYAPGAFNAGRPPIEHLTCDHDYTLVTPHPGHGGRYTIMVNARTAVRGPQRYHLQVGRAGADDIAPGVLIPNFARISGHLDGDGVDALDLYRFNVTSLTRLFLSLKAGPRSHFDLMVIDPLGDKLACSCGANGNRSIVKDLKRGNYYVAVRAQDATRGNYRLTRASRQITATHQFLSSSILDPGTPEQFTVNVSPAVSGPVGIVIEQLDPLAGWQYLRTLHATATDGHATVGFVAASVGHFRARTVYKGTRDTATSHTGLAQFIVSNPDVG